MGRFSSSIELFKSSWTVLKQDKELLALPVLSALASLATIGLFAWPVFTSIDFDAVAADGSSTIEPSAVTAVLVAAAYLLLAFVSIFFNSALVHAANERMDGGDPNILTGLAGAASRLGRIAPWAIVSATVSFIIRQIQERAGVFGSVLGFLAGMAWAAVTFLVLPILVIENIGVMDAIKRSASLLKAAWGEGLAGHLGLGLIGFLAALPFVVIGGIGVFAAEAAITVPMLVVAALGLVAVTVVMSALSVVYQTALYRFATAQPVSSFGGDLMQNAFRTKG